MFAFFKFSGAIVAGLANIFIIMHSDNIEDVIKDFIAVEVIIEIDNIFATTVDREDLKETFIYVNRKRYDLPDSAVVDLYIKDDIDE